MGTKETDGWCRTCNRMWRRCDMADGECARHHHAAVAQKLEAENKRLRKALQRIADGDEVMRDGHTEMVAVADAEAIAREALMPASQ